MSKQSDLDVIESFFQRKIKVANNIYDYKSTDILTDSTLAISTSILFVAILTLCSSQQIFGSIILSMALFVMIGMIGFNYFFTNSRKKALNRDWARKIVYLDGVLTNLEIIHLHEEKPDLSEINEMLKAYPHDIGHLMMEDYDTEWIKKVGIKLSDIIDQLEENKSNNSVKRRNV